MTRPTVDELIGTYRAALVAMDAVNLAEEQAVRRWNSQLDRVQTAQLQLRRTAEGRAAIASLIDDPVPTVAVWAAAHALFWDEVRARGYLESHQDLTSRTTLREFDARRLHHDWEPRGRPD